MAIQETPEATGDLIGNEIADKITSISKSSNELHSNEYIQQKELIMKYQKKYRYPHKNGNKLLMN